jgi:hypothetical protein
MKNQLTSFYYHINDFIKKNHQDIETQITYIETQITQCDEFKYVTEQDRKNICDGWVRGAISNNNNKLTQYLINLCPFSENEQHEYLFQLLKQHMSKKNKHDIHYLFEQYPSLKEFQNGEQNAMFLAIFSEQPEFVELLLHEKNIHYKTLFDCLVNFYYTEQHHIELSQEKIKIRQIIFNHLNKDNLTHMLKAFDSVDYGNRYDDAIALVKDMIHVICEKKEIENLIHDEHNQNKPKIKI